jgi:hypothetical protein
MYNFGTTLITTGIPDRVERRTGIKPFTVVPLGVDWLANGLPDIGTGYTIHMAVLNRSAVLYNSYTGFSSSGFRAFATT